MKLDYVSMFASVPAMFFSESEQVYVYANYLICTPLKSFQRSFEKLMNFSQWDNTFVFVKMPSFKLTAKILDFVPY